MVNSLSLTVVLCLTRWSFSQYLYSMVSPIIMVVLLSVSIQYGLPYNNGHPTVQDPGFVSYVWISQDLTTIPRPLNSQGLRSVHAMWSNTTMTNSQYLYGMVYLKLMVNSLSLTVGLLAVCESPRIQPRAQGSLTVKGCGLSLQWALLPDVVVLLLVSI